MTQLRDHVGRALYEEPNTDADWAALSDERREPWRKDADRIIPIIAAEYAAITAKRVSRWGVASRRCKPH